jgi:4-amino-4-deoxy-L-arabinose transferase-like glycosyltransferase
VLIAALLPGFVTMMRSRFGVYEEAETYAYTAALGLWAGTIVFARAPTRRRYLILLAAAGAVGLIRPTAWFYGLGAAVVATAVYLRAERRRALPAIAVGLALFCAGGAALYATNVVRFGAGGEFGHRLNIEALPGNVRATRFSYPFERVGWIEGSKELVGSLFGRPEQSNKKDFYSQHLHPWQSDTPRWREYYFTTFSWPYLPLILAGLVFGVVAWKKRRDERWPALWAVIGAGPLLVFYVHSPSMSSRYTLDLAPAIVALLVIAWRAAAVRWKWSAAVLGALWLVAVITSKSRPHVANDVIDRDAAITTRDALSRPMEQLHAFPDHYDVTNLGTPHLYINGSGWDPTSLRAPPATHFYVDDPQFLELTIEPANARSTR